MAAASLDEVDQQIRDTINSLYLITTIAHDYKGPDSQKSMTTEIKILVSKLVSLCQISQRVPNHIPFEIIEYVEQTRNPDIYTRQFVELVMRYNQSIAGQSRGLAQFRDILGKEIMSAIPDLSQDVRDIMVATGGSREA